VNTIGTVQQRKSRAYSADEASTGAQNSRNKRPISALDYLGIDTNGGVV
jgi:hypothetical protein